VSDVHAAAAAGYAQGAETYARGRPGFPTEALDWLTNDLRIGPGKTVVELGAGTGKFTQWLVQTKADVIAVEPVVAMLARLQADLPGVRTLRATAQNLPFANASVGAVICAQSFHWFASRESLAEIRRVLEPDGALGLIWNVRDQSVPWVAELTRIMEPYEGDAPRYDKGQWRKVFPAPGFGPLEEKAFAHAHVGSAERVIVDRVASVSFIAALDEATRDEVLGEVRALIAATPELADMAEVSAPYETRAYRAIAC
jgi:SAM-dependent methyltransferase